MLIVLNLSEDQQAPEIEYPHRHSQIVPLQGKLEMDIAQLPPDEMAMFLEEYGIEEPSLNRMIRLSYDLLGLQSFFTVGQDECRAWTVDRGATAPEAAGVIHTDLQKGFIRAEVVAYDDLMSLGGMTEAKAHGKFRLEGKEYIVKDGDILNIRFACVSQVHEIRSCYWFRSSRRVDAPNPKCSVPARWLIQPWHVPNTAVCPVCMRSARRSTGD